MGHEGWLTYLENLHPCLGTQLSYFQYGYIKCYMSAQFEQIRTYTIDLKLHAKFHLNPMSYSEDIKSYNQVLQNQDFG